MSLKPELTADSIMASAKALGLRIERPEKGYFDLEKRCACPAGIAAIMWDPHLARENFGHGKAFGVLGLDASGLVFGFDLGWRPPKGCTGGYAEMVTIGVEIRNRMAEVNGG